MWITKKQLNEQLNAMYIKGQYKGLFDTNKRQETYLKTKYIAILHSVLPELEELGNNTWDKDRVERIRKILITGLS